MKIKIIDEEGREFEFRGEYRTPIAGDDFMGIDCRVHHFARSDYNHMVTSRAIVHPIPKPPVYHDFGGVRFEETEKPRFPQVGEFYWLNKEVCLWQKNQLYGYSQDDSIILKPVAIIDQEHLGKIE